MLKKLQWSIGLLLFFFVLPVIAGQLPFNKQASTPVKEAAEDKQMVYAAINPAEEALLDSTKIESTKDPFQVLILFTHSHESYGPIVQKLVAKLQIMILKQIFINLRIVLLKNFNRMIYKRMC